MTKKQIKEDVGILNMWASQIHPTLRVAVCALNSYARKDKAFLLVSLRSDGEMVSVGRQYYTIGEITSELWALLHRDDYLKRCGEKPTWCNRNPFRINKELSGL